VVTTGGTGMSPRDSTYEVVSRLLTKRMDGFGELFRMVPLRRTAGGRRRGIGC